MIHKPAIPPALLYPVLVAATALAIWFGSQNKPDPVWQQAESIVNGPYTMLDDATDSIELFYAALHPGKRLRPADSTGYKILSTPHLRTLSWPKFHEFCNAVESSRQLIVSGVTGTGATKVAEKAAAFMATRPEENVLMIHCSPEFDIDLHKKYIGWEDEKQQFHPGILLQFWEQCAQHPKERFVCVIDNLDKINPEAFFGPELWEHLSSPKEEAIIGGQKIALPPNFRMLSVTHLGPGSRIEFNEEHFKRLGRRYVIEPDACELLDYLDKAVRDLKTAGMDEIEKNKAKLAALTSMSNRRRLVFYFLKANELMRKKYGPGFELGQGSNVRRNYMPDKTDDLKDTYITHINSIRGVATLQRSDFDDLDYTVQSGGFEPHTNFFDRQIKWLSDTGYLVEITMVSATALLTTLIGWWIFRRREKLIRNYGDMAQQVYNQFEAQGISAEEASRTLENIKNQVNTLVLQRKLNYTEGLYFIGFVEDKVRRIDFAKNVSENFLELFNAFMEDNFLSENEYNKLCQFLQSIRHKIPEETYRTFIRRVELAYKNSMDKQ